VIVGVALALALTTPPDHWFGADKLKHFFVAAFAQSVTYSALQVARVRHDQALIGASAVTTLVSVAKEVHDRRTTGLFSARDLVWDAAGAGMATVLLERARRSGESSRDPAPATAASARVGWSRAISLERPR